MRSYTVIVSFEMSMHDVKATNREEALNKALWRLTKKMQRTNSRGWPMGLKALVDRKNTLFIKNTDHGKKSSTNRN